MPSFLKQDDAVWLRHLSEVGIHVPVGQPVRLRVDGLDVDFIPMRPDRHGRPTHGLKATGVSADHWRSIPRGTAISLERCTQAHDAQVPDATNPGLPGLPRLRSGRAPVAETSRSRADAPVATSGVLRTATEADVLPMTTGAVIGLDVGYSETAATTGFCILSWDNASVTWACRNARSSDTHRDQVLASLAPRDLCVRAVAVDGPLVPGLSSHSRYRACEAILSSGPLQKRGKPGQTNAGSGPRLHQEAITLGQFALDRLEVGDAAHACRIHEKAVVEAFPNMFLGTLCDEAGYPERPARSRKWTDTLFPIVVGRLRQLVEHLLPGREILGSWDVVDHEEIAGLTCAITALCVSAGQFTAVGADDDGWIILPPKAFMGSGWPTTLTACCSRVRASFPGARVIW